MSAYTVRALTGTGFEIDIEPGPLADLPANQGAVQLRLRNASTTKMTAAGMAAVVARINTYYTASKLLAIQRANLDQTPSFGLSDTGATLFCLAADIETWVTNLTSDLAGTVNLTGGTGDAIPIVASLAGLANATVLESAGSVTLAFTLSQPATQAVVLRYDTTNGTAVSPTNYTAVVAGSVTIPAGDTTPLIAPTITIVNAHSSPANNTFTVTIQKTSGPTEVTLDPAHTVATITITGVA